MVTSGSASKFHVAAAKTKPYESRTIAPTPSMMFFFIMVEVLHKMHWFFLMQVF